MRNIYILTLIHHAKDAEPRIGPNLSMYQGHTTRRRDDGHGAHSSTHRPHPLLGAMEKSGATTGAGSVPRALPGAVSSPVSGAVSITDRLKGDES